MKVGVKPLTHYRAHAEHLAAEVNDQAWQILVCVVVF